jgi:single-strand DNA-binding protein
MNRVLLTGRLTRDPELRTTATGKHVTSFSVATNEYFGNGKERSEFHNVITWDKLAEICGRYLGKGQTVVVEGRLQTRSWDDDQNKRHWKTEVVASSVEMIAGRRKKDYQAETAANALESQALAMGALPASEPIPDDSGFAIAAGIEDEIDDEELDDAEESEEDEVAEAVA